MSPGARERVIPVVVAGRLDAIVRAALPGLSRRVVRALITEGAVRVDGHRAAKGGRVPAGAVVTLPELSAGVVAEPDLAVPVVYQDAHLVVLDKPGGMPAHALDPRQRGTAAASLLARYPETRDVGDPLAPGLVHRLDTGTSGLLLGARTSEVHMRLRAALRARAVEKRYLAVVAGHPRSATWVVDAALAHDPHDRRRMIPARAALRACPRRPRCGWSAGPARTRSWRQRSGRASRTRCGRIWRSAATPCSATSSTAVRRLTCHPAAMRCTLPGSASDIRRPASR